MKWLREPLAHFLALGAALFVLFGLCGEPAPTGERIVISAPQVELLAEDLRRALRRAPTERELSEAIEEQIREEISYREALALGLDRGDTLVRQHLRQKLEFFADDLAASAEPDERELRTYLAEHPELFRVDAVVSFEQVYFDPGRRGDAAADDAREALARLGTAAAPDDLSELGDRLALPTIYRRAPLDKVAGRFGGEFARRIAELPLGEWEGPVTSDHGLHLVRILEREPGRLPAFEEAREAVERAWRAARRAQAREAYYRGLRERYEVVVERPEAGG